MHTTAEYALCSTPHHSAIRVYEPFPKSKESHALATAAGPGAAPAPDDGALLLGQPLAVVDKTDGDRTHVYRSLVQPGLVGSTCAVGEPAPPGDP